MDNEHYLDEVLYAVRVQCCVSPSLSCSPWALFAQIIDLGATVVDFNRVNSSELL